MHAHCLQHVPFEGMAAIETWLNQKHSEITYTRFYQDGLLPRPDDIDWLIIMGGPMSVNDESQYPWLAKEKIFIRQCIEKQKTVIGICLGAQLIASSLGASVYQNSHTEIGWFPIQMSFPMNNPLFKDFPDHLPIFHWHGETFDLPENANLIAYSEACLNQVFTLSGKVIGFQCHPETTKESLDAMISHGRHELISGTFIQPEKEIYEHYNKYAKKMHETLFEFLDQLYKKP